MKLYGILLSPFVARVALACRYKGLDYELVRVLGPQLKEPGYLAINPLGKIPSLVDGDLTLPESGVICEYIEDKYPEPALLPDAAEDAARVRLICSLIDQYLSPRVMELTPHMSRRNRDTAVVEEGLQGINAMLDQIETLVAPRPFAIGDHPSLADCYLIPALFFLHHIVGTITQSDSLAAHSRLQSYWQFAQSEPHGKVVLEDIKTELTAFIERMKKQG